jgi:hypothetical protein
MAGWAKPLVAEVVRDMGQPRPYTKRARLKRKKSRRKTKAKIRTGLSRVREGMVVMKHPR